jgi:hypothetical protein
VLGIGSGSSVSSLPTIFDRLCGLLRPLVGEVLPPDLLVSIQESEWPHLISLASGNFAISHLAVALAGLRHSAIPTDVQDYFAAVLHLGEARSKSIQEQLGEIVVALNGASITPLLLKGAAFEAIGLYERKGTRLFSDLDLLIPADKITLAVAVLRSLGYQPDEAAAGMLGDQHHHLPEMTRPDRMAAIELHREPLRWQVRGLLPKSELVKESQRVSLSGGGAALVPSPTHLVLHNILHGQVSSYRHWAGHFLLKDAIDLVALDRRFGSEIDWPRISQTLESAALDGIAGFYVTTSFEIFGKKPPADIKVSGRAKLARAIWSAKQHGKSHPLMALMHLDLVVTVARRAIAERSMLRHLRSWLDLAFRRLAASKPLAK